MTGVRVLKMRATAIYRYSAPCRARGCENVVQGSWRRTREEALADAPPRRHQRCALHTRGGRR